MNDGEVGLLFRFPGPSLSSANYSFANLISVMSCNHACCYSLKVMVEGGVILECNTHGTLVLTARRFSPQMGLLQLQIYKTEYAKLNQQQNN